MDSSITDVSLPPGGRKRFRPVVKRDGGERAIFEKEEGVKRDSDKR